MAPPKAMALAGLLVAGCVAGACSAAGGDVDGADGAGTIRLSDVAGEVGLDFRHSAFRWSVSGDPMPMMAGGLCWIDYDRDGWLDLFVVDTWSTGEWSRWTDEGGLPRSRLFRNREGRFVDVTDETGAGRQLRGMGCVAADLDMDGWTDLYVTSERTNALLWNEGGRAFHEGAQEAGVAAPGWQSGAAVGDVDGDGWPDLFVAGYVDLNTPRPDATGGFPRTFRAVRDLLFLNQGPDQGDRVTFREVGQDVGIEIGVVEYGLGALWSDLDGDGDLDLYVANETDPNRLYENVAAGGAGGPGFRLVDRAAATGTDDDRNGMGIGGADYDGDGATDLLVTNVGGQGHAVFHNSGGTGRLSFNDGYDAFGVADLGMLWTGWGASFADLDLDTDLDLLLANGVIPVLGEDDDRQPVQAFANGSATGAPGFSEISDAVGLGELERMRGRGLAVADYDNDGDLDAAVASIAGDLVLLRNDGATGHWLEVAAEPSVPGAVVTVRLADGTELSRELRAGGSYLSSEDPRAHFGLGGADTVAELRVRWPDGVTTVRRDVPADQIVAVRPS